MPLRKFTPTHKGSSDPRELEEALVREWQQPGAGAQPLILVEDAPAGRKRLYVVWDLWKDLDDLERSELIMRVFERVHSPNEAATVSLAMGLTKQEAREAGIPDK